MQYRINRSPLVALLEQWEHAWSPPERQDVAAHWSQWLGALDAVHLDAALRGLDACAGVPANSARALDRTHLETRWAQGQADLQALVAQHSAPEAAPQTRTARRSHAPAIRAVAPEPPVYAAQHKRYLRTQRTMTQQVALLRAALRQLLAHGSRELQQLATLDAVLERLLAPREEKIWEGIARFLERRWQWRMAASSALPALGARAFEQDLQALLRAELAVRLLPLQGLVDGALLPPHTTWSTQ